MSTRPLFFWSLTLGVYCVQAGATYNIGDLCKSSECIIKCCDKNQIYLFEVYNETETRNCVYSSVLIKKFGVKDPNNYSEIDVYNKDIKHKIVKTDKSVNSFKFEYVVNFTNSANLVENVEELLDGTYLLEDGKFVIRHINYWNQWITNEPGQFCIEHEVTLYDGELDSTTPHVVVALQTVEPPANTRAVLSSYGLLVSCVFLLLVLAVYALLPELRNLVGLALMGHMATYFAFFMTRAIQVFGSVAEVFTMNALITITIIFYYLSLSTFCWMNVMSFDIWSMFRHTRKASNSHRHVMSKFRRYCAYAWGLPTLPTLFVVIMDKMDLTHLPNFVKPHIFEMGFFTPDVHLFYVSIPIFILICVNVGLFLLTAYNIWMDQWMVHRAVSVSKDSANNKKNESHKFWLYLRLSLVMGVSWILEMFSNLVHTESRWWIISDLYNSLVGLLIFLLFVCKKKIFIRLCTRLSIDNNLVRWARGPADDSRAADMQTKLYSSQHTEASEVEP